MHKNLKNFSFAQVTTFREYLATSNESSFLPRTAARPFSLPQIHPRQCAMGESRPHFSGLDYQRAYAQLKWKRGCALKARQQQQQQQQLLLEAPPATPEPAVSTTANTVDPSTTQGEAIDATATSRKGDSPTSWLCQKKCDRRISLQIFLLRDEFAPITGTTLSS